MDGIPADHRHAPAAVATDGYRVIAWILRALEPHLAKIAAA
ncbi:MAG: hypothetical protein WDN06_17185 [Asticcacaulis sp.]